MDRQVYSVPDVSCEHCVSAITEAVGPIDGVASVEVDLSAKTVAVTTATGATIDHGAVVAAIDDAGYDAVPVESAA
jgi:copper ion binding protein